MKTQKLLQSLALSSCLTSVGALAAAADGTASAYPTADDALQALLEAVVSSQDDALLAVFGEDAADLLDQDDPVEQARNKIEFLRLYAEGYDFSTDEEDWTWVLLGDDDWPFPIPLAETDAGWSFNIEQGREEIEFREIGLNELETMEIMEAYVAAQSLFRQIDHDGDGVMEFAVGILPSAPDARDGLFWQNPDSILGELIAVASLDGYFDGEEDQEPEALSGYYFRVLDSQGEAAPGGAMNYIVNGNKVAGHALLAVPAEYGETGIHTFMVAENGVLYEADLGDETLDVAISITQFNPAEPWAVVE